MKKIFSILLLAAAAATVMAVPAKRGPIVRTAEDGTQHIVYQHGNAHFHYLTNEAGEWLNEKTLQPMTAAEKDARLEAGIARKARRIQQQEQAGVLNLAPRGLLILVNFSDKQFQTPKETIENMLNGDNFTRDYSYSYTYQGKTYTDHVTASGSARQYFIDQSWGQYQPQFDVVGPVTVSKEYSYYGGNDSNGDDEHVDAMIKEACTLANNLGVDWTKYDNDGDNKVDFVYFIYAGYGEADCDDENTIWPHNYNYSYYYAGTLKFNGKKIDNYACSNEMNYLSEKYAGIGTFCHEFSHVLGLPDLYYTATSGTSPHTLLEWDIMDYGPYNNDGNTPPAYSAYERFYCGWLTPRVLKDPESVWLGRLNYDKTALLMCDGDSHNLNGTNPSPTTFYMIENRDQTGWDTHLPGKGMLLTKIQYSSSKWTGNTVNNTKSSMGVDIIEAKNNTTTGQSAIGKATDAFPAGATQYTGFSGHEITEIELNNFGAITFSYRGAEKTPIDNVDANSTATKILRDGKVFILRNGATYDLNGRMVK